MSRYHKEDVFAGRYLLVRHLGTGGFSEVWLARDQMAEEAEIVVKIFAPNRGLDEQGIRIFRKEYALTVPFYHPNLLKATHYDVFDGSPYLILPFCAGGSLMGQIFEEKPFDERAVAAVLQQVGEALAYLHEQEILHQDIKPDNVLIRQPGHYVLSDFGISTKMRRTIVKSISAEDALRYSAFTPGYAPPEKYVSRPTPAGDVFSLGMTLFELITHDLPFEDTGRALQEGAHIPALPAPYSPGLNQLVQACVALDPSTRPTAQDLAAAARGFLATGTWQRDTSKQEASTVSEKPPSAGPRITQPMPPQSPKGVGAARTPLSTEATHAGPPVAGASPKKPFMQGKKVLAAIVLAPILVYVLFQAWSGPGDQKRPVDPVTTETEEFSLQEDTLNGSHILIAYAGASRVKPTVTRTKEEAFAGAQILIAELSKDPTRFEDLAESFSDGPTGVKGGYLGVFAKDQMVPEFGEAMAALKIGQISSSPVETIFGYHIIRREALPE